MPLRTRSEPIALDGLRPVAVDQVPGANMQCEFIEWLLAQAELQRVIISDLSRGLGRTSSVRAVDVSIQIIPKVESVHEVRHTAAFLCQIADADDRRPLSLFTDVPDMLLMLCIERPSFIQTFPGMVYTCSLPKSCPCLVPHKESKGTDTGLVFFSAGASGGVLWNRWEGFAAVFLEIPKFRVEVFIASLIACVTVDTWVDATVTSRVRERSRKQLFLIACSRFAGTLWKVNSVVPTRCAVLTWLVSGALERSQSVASGAQTGESCTRVLEALFISQFFQVGSHGVDYKVENSEAYA